MSIRLRLTLVYTLILSLSLLTFGLVVYNGQRQGTLAFEERRLVTMAERIAQAHIVGVTPEAPQDRDPSRIPPGYIQFRTPSGDLVVASEGQGDVELPLSDRGLESVQALARWTETASIGGERVLIASVPVVVDGQLVEIAQAGASLAVSDQSISALRTLLLLGGGLAVILAFAAGWLLAGVALRPIHAITEIAQAIGAERDLSRRITHSGPRDEVGELASTLNNMLVQLEAAATRVDETLEAQRRFVADVSHELRTPLTTLSGNLALLRRDPPVGDADRDEILADMSAESDRLIRLVHDLLALARADAQAPGHRALEHQECLSAGPVIEDVCRQARLLDSDRSIVCDGIPQVEVPCDGTVLRRVLLTLLDNAIRHAQGPIQVSCKVTDAHVAVSVRDCGPGIPSEDVERIFERFYRGRSADSGAGSGLGLAIARALVEGQHGTLCVESEVGAGTVFTVTLPRAK